MDRWRDDTSTDGVRIKSFERIESLLPILNILSLFLNQLLVYRFYDLRFLCVLLHVSILLRCEVLQRENALLLTICHLFSHRRILRIYLLAHRFLTLLRYQGDTVIPEIRFRFPLDAVNWFLRK